IPAALAIGNVCAAKASFVTGFGVTSPTQLYVPPAVCAGTWTSIGTMRQCGILPMIVAGRRSAMKSAAMLLGVVSGPAHVASIGLPAATAALRYNATSGVSRSHRPLAYSAASEKLPLQHMIAHAARTKAVPGGNMLL